MFNFSLADYISAYTNELPRITSDELTIIDASLEVFVKNFKNLVFSDNHIEFSIIETKFLEIVDGSVEKTALLCFFVERSKFAIDNNVLDEIINRHLELKQFIGKFHGFNSYHNFNNLCFDSILKEIVILSINAKK
jgi:hypothetical protein